MTAKRFFFAGGALMIPVLGHAGVSGLNLLIGDLPDGKAIIITHSVTIDPAPAGAITSQGSVSFDGFPPVQTDDPDVPGFNPTITPVQQAPVVGGPLSRNIDEDMPFTLTLAEFESVFTDGNAGDSLQVLRILSLPGKGTLFRSGGGGAIAPGDLPADIARAQIAGTQFLPTPNASGPDQFTFTFSDGASFASPPGTYSIAIAEVNDAPLPLPDSIDRYATSSVKIPVATLLANDGDPSDSPPDLPLVVTAVSSPTANGAIVTLSGGVVYYNPNGHVGQDTFTYQVEDSRGGVFPNALVTVRIFDDTAPSLNIEVTVDPATGNASIAGAGIPGRTYRVQAADAGAPNWFDLPGGAVVAGQDGRFSYTDPGPLPPTRIYRTVHP